METQSRIEMYKLSGSMNGDINGTSLSWFAVITTPDIQGRMEKAQNSCLSKGKTGRGDALHTILLPRSVSPSLWPRRYCLTVGLVVGY
jgi:hypothetical protein